MPPADRRISSSASSPTTSALVKAMRLSRSTCCSSSSDCFPLRLLENGRTAFGSSRLASSGPSSLFPAASTARATSVPGLAACSIRTSPSDGLATNRPWGSLPGRVLASDSSSRGSFPLASRLAAGERSDAVFLLGLSGDELLLDFRAMVLAPHLFAMFQRFFADYVRAGSGRLVEAHSNHSCYISCTRPASAANSRQESSTDSLMTPSLLNSPLRYPARQSAAGLW